MLVREIEHQRLRPVPEGTKGQGIPERVLESHRAFDGGVAFAHGGWPAILPNRVPGDERDHPVGLRVSLGAPLSEVRYPCIPEARSLEAHGPVEPAPRGGRRREDTVDRVVLDRPSALQQQHGDEERDRRLQSPRWREHGDEPEADRREGDQEARASTSRPAARPAIAASMSRPARRRATRRSTTKSTRSMPRGP